MLRVTILFCFLFLAGTVQEGVCQKTDSGTRGGKVGFLGSIEGYKAVKALETDLYRAIKENDIDFILDKFYEADFLDVEDLRQTLSTISKDLRSDDDLTYKWYYSRQRDQSASNITLGYKWIDEREIIQYVIEVDLVYPKDQILFDHIRMSSFGEYQIQKMFPGGTMDRVTPPMPDPPKLGEGR